MFLVYKYKSINRYRAGRLSDGLTKKKRAHTHTHSHKYAFKSTNFILADLKKEEFRNFNPHSIALSSITICM